MLPQDLGYDAARSLFNAMIDRRPLVIVECADASDVSRSIESARAHGVELCVRAGGHNVAGIAVRDGAVMIDLSQMKAIRVDPDRRTVRAEAGLTLGEFDRANHSLGWRARWAWCR